MGSFWALPARKSLSLTAPKEALPSAGSPWGKKKFFAFFELETQKFGRISTPNDLILTRKFFFEKNPKFSLFWRPPARKSLSRTAPLEAAARQLAAEHAGDRGAHSLDVGGLHIHQSNSTAAPPPRSTSPSISAGLQWRTQTRKSGLQGGHASKGGMLARGGCSSVFSQHTQVL